MLFEVTLVSACIVLSAIICSAIVFRKFSCLSCHLKYHYLGLKYHLHDIINIKHNQIDLSSKPNKVAIVTGGSRGIGAEVVKKLLQCDMEVIIACRTLEAGNKLIDEIRKSGIVSGKAKVYKLDNASFESVRSFAKRIKTDYDQIHILINNAAIMFPAVCRKTEDGYEEQWAVNYLSHFLLTSLLLPLLKAGGRPGECSRIVNVSSCAQDVGTIIFDNNDFSGKTFCTHAGYGQSKLAQTMSTITLQKLLNDKSLNVLVYVVHPGIVKTDLFKEQFVSNNKIKWIMSAWKTPDQGATSVVYAAISKDIEKKGGIYISNCKERFFPLSIGKEEIHERLFKLSLKQVHLKDFFQYL
ncbi:dehydrogenase/reductase SDR family member on chromosome X [Solenopsis invicta]|uniref:dehydrogenase/reductase SDR family member on chromosome X n=1 Tax=Solenopsis invicta TaxID=13686 RepID=UPI00193DBDBF|nr:dehydrogenase/reductase SDR family member on chromosome X [Solenopsis invicta]XP_025986712.2 dehydrogenase/reductase SDR family member on chromosome X [Solenopsis invicta]XP_025986713.2 dehydrogenase/reductase SDR family member on chromosome X [Solenopsis invicta]XP_039305862.1 dehydrogenase/reductase SDR family member on chromosome X [Solenopsis invicta]XP_039305863.1 dehydrogenase/reductase SDR family member on chromosome X [Solenopsis invicta]